MQDIASYLEKLRAQVAECELIRDLATDPQKQELFTRLAKHFKVVASELEGALEVSDTQPNRHVTLSQDEKPHAADEGRHT
jgi:hypothetical protein